MKGDSTLDDGQAHSGIIASLLKYFKKNTISKQEKMVEEIADLISHGAEDGTIPESSGEMIQSIFEFSDTIARKIMTPRVSVVGIEKNATLGEIIEICKEEGYSRLPIYEDDLDHIIGFVVSKDLLKYWGKDLNAPLPEELIRKPAIVSYNKKIGDILSDLRHKKTHFAVVIDEFGGTSGVITVEDILEEIIGEIDDEHDTDDDEIKKLSGNVYLVYGHISIDDLNEELSIELPEGEYDTLGGFLIHILGRMPEFLETIEWGKIRFVIREGDDRKVERVEIRLPDNN